VKLQDSCKYKTPCYCPLSVTLLAEPSSSYPQSKENIFISVTLNCNNKYEYQSKLFREKGKIVNSKVQNISKQGSPLFRVLWLAALPKGIGCNSAKLHTNTSLPNILAKLHITGHKVEVYSYAAVTRH
jgi:hypothetical protein